MGKLHHLPKPFWTRVPALTSYFLDCRDGTRARTRVSAAVKDRAFTSYISCTTAPLFPTSDTCWPGERAKDSDEGRKRWMEPS